MENVLFTTIGISGSGKSHYFNTLFENHMRDFLLKNPKLAEKLPIFPIKSFIVEPDNLRRVMFGSVDYPFDREPWLWDNVEYALKYRLDNYGLAVMDSTFVDGGGRSRFLKNFEDSYKVAIVFKNDYDLSIERIKLDIYKGKDRSNVPEYIVSGQNIKFIRSVIGEYVDEDSHSNYKWNENTEDKIRKQLSSKFDEIIIIK